VWATRISFLDVLSAVPPFLSHARKSKPAERRDRSQSTLFEEGHLIGLLSLLSGKFVEKETVFYKAK
jgi:hypothetical protein